MTVLLYFGASIAALFVLIMVHESGHFLAARLFDVQVERFSIGFGKPIYTWKGKKGETEYAVAPFFLGGYVSLLDTRETKVSEKYWSRAFNRQSPLKKIAIVAAGPIANVIFSFFAFWLMFVIGFKLPKPIIANVVSKSIASYSGIQSNSEIIKIDQYNTMNWNEVIIAMLARTGDHGTLDITIKKDSVNKVYHLNLDHWIINSYNPDPLLDFGLVRYKPDILPIIDKIGKRSPAEKFGLKAGDQVLKINDIKINTWDGFIKRLKRYPRKNIRLLILRSGEEINVKVRTDWKFDQRLRKIGYLGVSVDKDKIVWPKEMLRNYDYNFLQAVPEAVRQMGLFLNLNRIMLSKLVMGEFSLRVLGGPLSTLMASGQALTQGFVMFLGFLGMISLTLAFINLLPIPGADGGQCILILIEKFRGRQLSLRVQLLIFRLGVALVVLLMLHTTANDIVRLFG